MSPFVKVFGCRPYDGGATRTGAGVRKPPREETASRVDAAASWSLGLWGFERGGAREGVNLSGGRGRLQAQLQRYGMDIAKWGFRLLPYV